MIKPCKECGNKDLKVRGHGFYATIECRKCNNIRGGFSTREVLIDVWNRENSEDELKLGDCGICKNKDTEGETSKHIVNFVCTECIKLIDEWNSLDNL